MARTYKVKVESNQLRGLEHCTIVFVEDQYGTVWQDREFARADFDNLAAYRRAVSDKVAGYKNAWKDEVEGGESPGGLQQG